MSTGTSANFGTAPRILIIGANGQLGTELAAALAERYGTGNVVTSDMVPRGHDEGA